MTLKEAAEFIGVTPDTLRQQIANGKLRATKRGRDWWVTKGEVRRYQDENQTFYIMDGHHAVHRGPVSRGRAEQLLAILQTAYPDWRIANKGEVARYKKENKR